MYASRPGLTLRPSLFWSFFPAALFALLALLIWTSGINQNLFIAWNQTAYLLLPAGLWAGLTNAASTLGILALAAPTLAWQPRWIASALIAAPAASLYAQGIKHLLKVARPPAVLSADTLHIVGEPLYKNSFPSGHTVTAFLVAGAIILSPRHHQSYWLAPAVLLIAVILSFSRIAVAAHWPLDLFAGAAGGWLCAAFGALVTAHWRFWETARGIRIMAAIAAIASIALIFADLGYPEGRWAQFLLGSIGISGALYTWRRHRPQA